MSGPSGGNISVPRVVRAPRDLTDVERETLATVADTLVPGRDGAPAASAEPGFWDNLVVALDARADAFDDITSALASLGSRPTEEMWDELKTLDRNAPATFQALSTVITGAWLLTPGTRERIGYDGPQSDRAGIEEAADDITSGILDPVIERQPGEGCRWIR